MFPDPGPAAPDAGHETAAPALVAALVAEGLADYPLATGALSAGTSEVRSLPEQDRSAPVSRAPALIGAPAALRVALVVALVALVALVVPFLAWLVLAAWVAAAVRPWLAGLAGLLGGRRRGAAMMTLGLLVLIVGPIVTLVGLLAADAVELGARVSRSASGREALAQLVSSDEVGGITFEPGAILSMLEGYGARAVEVAGALAGMGAELALGVFVFFTAAYVLLVDGPVAWTWTVEHAPLDEPGLDRLRRAFYETGRGLFVGIGLTGLVQAGIATIAYLALGVPRPLVLGLVTFFASVLPTVGAALVWVPVSIALAMTGRTTAAIVLALVGVLVVSSIDNLLRPLLMQSGRLELHTFLLLISMLGGLAILGTPGLFLGPLIARLAVEIIRMARESGLVGRGSPSSSPESLVASK